MITGGADVATLTTVIRFLTTCPRMKFFSPVTEALSASVFGIHISEVPGRRRRL
jgi:hypothetical protein